jgi:precorrin-2 dehydrogenase/sirohydrochlorin ferrochelatase
MIPLYHDFSDETVLVFGGGSVGARKARRFAREAAVVVVSPSFGDADYGDAELVRAAPGPDDVPGWFRRTEPALAVAATDDEGLNDAVEAEAADRDVLVNRADRSGERPAGSVVVPATVRDGDVVVSVSTSGTSPAVSKELRRRLEDDLEGVGDLAALTAEVRDELRRRDVDPERRRAVLRGIVRSPRVWKDLGRGRTNRRQTVNAVVDAALGEST